MPEATPMRFPTQLFEKASNSSSYNEAFSPTGEFNNQWMPLVHYFNARGRNTLGLDHGRAARMRHEDGATINPFDSQTEQSSSWALDILPLPIAAEEWNIMEAAVQQRAGLLERVLADTYSQQELLQNGLIPPELVFANPNFIHACHNIHPSGNRFLSFYGIDLYREPGGQFKVLRDYGSSPLGLGYSLENRIVMSRLFPALYHQTRIRRLAPFFQSFHRSLIRRAALDKNEDRIVFLSPGPDCPYYFEHALLSRYLGYPLVEGQDLTVRNGNLFLKKLAGLEPVEAIFRNIEDLSSDPFALRRETSQGVAGLIQVSREQNLDIINPIGAGFIDSPLLKIFLPNLCQYLLGENLLLENHPSWWCETEEGRNMLQREKDCTNLRHAFDSSMKISRNQVPSTVIAQRPYDFILDAPLQPSSAPCWSDRSSSSEYTIFRLFACASDNGFEVMPGGLAITAKEIPSLLQGRAQQQKSKDIWVLSDEPVVPFTLLEGFDAIPEFKRSGDLPNRVADNLLWLGRYLERAEGLVRLLRPVYKCLLGEDRPEDNPELYFLLNILSAKDILPPGGKHKEDDPRFLQLSLYLDNAMFNNGQRESVLSNLQRVRETARNVRDRLSIDSFRIINRLEDFTKNSDEDPLELLDKTLLTLNGFSGLAMESMTRGLGWSFMDLGRRTERATNQITLLTTSLPLVCSDSQVLLQALLEISDSLMTYRSRYRSSFQPAPVLDLLISDESNPKSLAFQLKSIADHVANLPRPETVKFSSSEERLALEMLTTTRLLDLTVIDCKKLSLENNPLSGYLENMASLINEFNQQVSAHYLSRIPTTPHYTSLSPVSLTAI